MRKPQLMLLLITALLLFSFPAFAGEDEYGEKIQDALELVKTAWQEQSDQYPEMMPSPYVDIKNTRIVQLYDKPVDVQSEKPVTELEGIDYIIEFMMLSNYYGDTYPCNVGIYDSIAVYTNGKMEMQKTNLLNAVRAKYFLTDYSSVIEEIIDLGGEYNGQLFGD